MEAVLDKFGRIIIPKEVRESLGLRPGSTFFIEEVNQEIHLKPIEGTPNVKNKDGWLVYSGEPTGDLIRVIEEERAKRIQKISGLKK